MKKYYIFMYLIWGFIFELDLLGSNSKLLFPTLFNYIKGSNFKHKVNTLASPLL